MAAKKATARKKSPAKKATVKKVAAKKSQTKAIEAKGFKAKFITGKMPTPGALIAEFLGSFILAGAFIMLFTSGIEGKIGIALALIAVTIIFGVLSRSHFNPAITIALWANRRVSGMKTILYIIAQGLGAMLAWFILMTIFNTSFEGTIVANLLAQGVSQSMIDDAGGLLEFAKANGFDTLNDLAARIGIAPFVDIDISKTGLITFFSELMGAIIFGLAAGYAFIKDNKPAVKAIVLGFGLFAGLLIGGANVVLNPAVAGALGAFFHAWNSAELIMWPLITYIVATIAGITIGVTAFRFLLKDAGSDEDDVIETKKKK